MPAVPCASCWEPYSENGTATRMCPESKPYVSGQTESCGCMDPYHNKVCTEARCCSVTYECYGNCGDYFAMYIFLGVVVVATIVGVTIYTIKRKNDFTNQPTTTTATSTTTVIPVAVAIPMIAKEDDKLDSNA
mmetsp:Transcript_8203/g.13906  ORF Transcript_8203/g.13906 Transcript_8203/m.13906 type:complete len:133 (-) Transcript_8203:296-694(-)